MSLGRSKRRGRKFSYEFISIRGNMITFMFFQQKASPLASSSHHQNNHWREWYFTTIVGGFHHLCPKTDQR